MESRQEAASVGKGDKRTAKGKRYRGTFGRSRPKNRKTRAKPKS